MIGAFPKIFAIGTTYIKDIFKNDVEVTEKVDGSQFGFGKVNGELIVRSKGQQLNLLSPEKMFSAGVDYVKSIEHKLPDNKFFYAEYLQRPKHNVLTYSRVPKNHLILFGIMNLDASFEDNLEYWADKFDIESVPVIYRGNISSPDFLKGLLERDSILGGAKIEGVVVKNYSQQFLLGGQPIPIMAGKFVSEAFKEVHRNNWGKENTTKGKFETFKESFCTEARWQKAIQHLKEVGDIESSPKDIGKLIVEIHRDIEHEEKENIKEFLYNEFKREIVGTATKGFPEWYKEQLLKSNFEDAA